MPIPQQGIVGDRKRRPALVLHTSVPANAQLSSPFTHPPYEQAAPVKRDHLPLMCSCAQPPLPASRCLSPHRILSAQDVPSIDTLPTPLLLSLSSVPTASCLASHLDSAALSLSLVHLCSEAAAHLPTPSSVIYALRSLRLAAPGPCRAQDTQPDSRRGGWLGEEAIEPGV